MWGSFGRWRVSIERDRSVLEVFVHLTFGSFDRTKTFELTGSTPDVQQLSSSLLFYYYMGIIIYCFRFTTGKISCCNFLTWSLPFSVVKKGCAHAKRRIGSCQTFDSSLSARTAHPSLQAQILKLSG